MPLRSIQGLDELRTLAGQELSTSDWIPVTQQMIDAFADVTGDHQWIHVDIERSQRESPFNTTIAHGFLTLSLVTRMFNEAIRVEGDRKLGLNYGLNRVRFTSPVRAGSRVRARVGVASVDEVAGGVAVQVTWSIAVELEGEDKPALVAEWISRWYA